MCIDKSLFTYVHLTMLLMGCQLKIYQMGFLPLSIVMDTCILEYGELFLGKKKCPNL